MVFLSILIGMAAGIGPGAQNTSPETIAARARQASDAWTELTVEQITDLMLHDHDWHTAYQALIDVVEARSLQKLAADITSTGTDSYNGAAVAMAKNTELYDDVIEDEIENDPVITALFSTAGDKTPAIRLRRTLVVARLALSAHGDRDSTDVLDGEDDLPASA